MVTTTGARTRIAAAPPIVTIGIALTIANLILWLSTGDIIAVILAVGWISNIAAWYTTRTYANRKHNTARAETEV